MIECETKAEKTTSSVSRHATSAFLLLFLTVASAAFCLNLAASLTGAPITSGDQNWFLPVVWAFSQTGVLFHPLNSPIPGNPEQLLIWHGWMMPWLQGALNPLRDYQNVRVSGDLIALTTFFAYTNYLYRRFGKIYTTVCIPVIGALLLYQVGRPELIISTILIIYFYGERKVAKTPIMASTISLLAVTSPAPGFLVAVLLLLRLYCTIRDSREFFKIILKVVVIVPLLIYLGTLTVAEIDPLNWLQGIVTHGLSITADQSQNLLKYTLIHPSLPLNFFLILPLLAILTYYTKEKLSTISILGAIFLLIMTWYLSLRQPVTIYNFLALTPLIIVGYGEVGTSLRRGAMQLVAVALLLLSLA